MSEVYFDGDLRRVYEVPDNPAFTVDGQGYRTYTGTGDSSISATELWSRWVDYHGSNKWAALAFSKAGGAYRDTVNGADVYATFDLRLINGWQMVQADYKHQWLIIGNVFKEIGLDSTFDTDRITSQGVVASVNFSDSLQTSVQTVNSGSGLSEVQSQALVEMLELQRWTYRAHYHKRYRNPNTEITTIYDTDKTTPLREFDEPADGSLIDPRFAP